MNDAEPRAPRGLIGLALVLVVVPALVAEAADVPAASADRVKRERLLALYTREAERYSIYRDASRKEKVELRRKPVYVWTNPARERGQDGAVFVWTCRGRAEVVGTVFSFPPKGRRGLNHELHSLATTALDVTLTGPPAPSTQPWTPKVPGLTLATIPGAPAPERSPAQRLVRMHALAGAFTGTTADLKEHRWDLRLLPQPLYRYESTDPDVLDGALFAFVSSEGTDPEALLVLEARKDTGASDPTWHYAVARYTDRNLKVRYKGRDVLTLPFLSAQTDPDGPYRVFQDRIIPPIEGENPAAAP